VTLLALDRLEARYGDVPALHGVSLRVEEGTIVALLGANGAGKTTTLRAISGLVRKSGEVAFGGRRITRYSPERIARLGIAHVLEGRGVMGELTVRENLRLGAHLRWDGGVKRDLAQVYGYFPVLEERQTQLAGTLSGGQQQMLVIGRALMARPKLLMLDEPSMGLAPIYVERIFETVVAINNEGTPILLVEQNALMALDVARRGYVMETGRIAIEGPASELKTNEEVRKTYLGEG
jgi:branched-chain amino acid transport system ATP-binding protein